MTGCPLLDSEYAARQNGKRLPCERLAEENERLRGTCWLDFVEFTKDGVDFAGFRCDGCGFTQSVPGGSLWNISRYWSYCPNCGKQVVA